MFKEEERGDKFAAGFGPAQVSEMVTAEFGYDGYDARPPMMYYQMQQQRWFSPLNGPANGYPPMPPQQRPPPMAPLSYSHKMPDVVTRVTDNDSQRRQNEFSKVFGAGPVSEAPPSIVASIEEWFATGTEVFMFTVEEQPRAYNTVHATGQLSFCVWKVDAQTKQITGICGMAKARESFGTYNAPQQAEQISRVLTLLFRCNPTQVQVYPQESGAQVLNALKYMRESFVERQPRVYLHLCCLPSAVELLLDQNAAFLNAAALSLYQSSLSWCKLAL